MSEQVLVFRAENVNLEKFDKSPFISSFTNDDEIDEFLVSKFLSEIFNKDNLLFMDRTEAECNENFKQIIPYIMLMNNKEEVFCYQRTKKSGESRLHGKWSIGIGGHINPIDGKAAQEETYWSAVKRELLEEIKISGMGNNSLAQYTPKLISGFIYNKSLAVGRVHFGIVHTIFVGDAQVETNEDCLTNGQFVNTQILKDRVNEFEDWSALLINS